MRFEPVAVVGVVGRHRVERQVRGRSRRRSSYSAAISSAAAVAVGRELRVSGEVLGGPGRLTGLDPELQVDVDEFDEQLVGGGLYPAR